MTGGVSGWIPIAALVCGLAGAALVDVLPLPATQKYLRTTPERLRTTLSFLGWQHLAYVLILVVGVQAFALYGGTVSEVATSAARAAGERWNQLVTSLGRSSDHLLTRPVCESADCSNFDFLVRECESEAAAIGGLIMESTYARADTEGATAYFRGCLIDRGLSWVSCERGQPDCRLLRGFYRRLIGSEALPSFVAVVYVKLCNFRFMAEGVIG